eukprot:5405479-Amphidinium_carterae.1
MVQPPPGTILSRMRATALDCGSGYLAANDALIGMGGGLRWHREGMTCNAHLGRKGGFGKSLPKGGLMLCGVEHHLLVSPAPGPRMAVDFFEQSSSAGHTTCIIQHGESPEIVKPGSSTRDPKLYHRPKAPPHEQK